MERALEASILPEPSAEVRERDEERPIERTESASKSEYVSHAVAKGIGAWRRSFRRTLVRDRKRRR